LIIRFDDFDEAGDEVKQRFALVVIFALVVSGAAAAVLYRLLSSQFASARAGSEHKILVASRNLASGDLIKEADVTLASWAGPVPPGGQSKVEDVVNRGVVETIFQGEAVVESRLAARGAGAGLAATIPTGMRAVAIRVNDVAGISGFATPGMRVDILIAGNPPGGNNTMGTVTKTLLQNIQILSAGQNIQRDAEGKPVSVPVVNLLVTPEQAETLSLASNEARIQLVLRNPTDKVEAKTPGTTLSYLFNGAVPEPPKPVYVPRPVARQAPPPPPPPAAAPEPPKPPPPILVEVIHGSRKVETKFDGEVAGKGNSQEGKAK
jgi:pilus assembly protein CpaB